MIGRLKKIYYDFRGFDQTGSAVPMMDGPLTPNTSLDQATVALTLPGVDNLVATSGGIMCSQGSTLLLLNVVKAKAKRGTLEIKSRQEFGKPITCLASDGDSGLAIGIDGRGVIIQGGPHDGVRIEDLVSSPLNCPVAALFLDRDTLVIANGSVRHDQAQWKNDLMGWGASGSVWRVSLKGKKPEASALLQNCAFPYGLAAARGGTLLVAEAWRHRVLSTGQQSGTSTSVSLGDLPAYPSRISSADGGYWLSLFAPRNQLIEFVLKEDNYRAKMMAGIHSDHWIAPSLLSGVSFLEPIQGGTRKKLNQLKPWSPTWSYGLVVRCDASMRPLYSLHSRADGHVHGVTSTCEAGGLLFVGAKGSGVIKALELASLAELAA